MAERTAHTYPFAAIVGQDTLKAALLINAVDPRVGGLLVRGEKGTAKSTAVRALASLLPPAEVVAGCPYGCDPDGPNAALCSSCASSDGPLPRTVRRAPFAELPLSATEDRLVGSLDLETVLSTGERAFQPGILASANRGVLYVDEVNLLDDHLVDTLLDVAAMGVNVVEREGISIAHPSRFVLVGTMNPDEGELRPQLLDRFGLCVDVAGEREPEARVEIMRRRDAFDRDADAFIEQWCSAEDSFRAAIALARARLAHIHVSNEILYTIATLSVAAEVEGHRADHVMVRAARSLAAIEGCTCVELQHLEAAAPLVLLHRMRRSALDDPAEALMQTRTFVARALEQTVCADDEGSLEGVSAAAEAAREMAFQPAHAPGEPESSPDITLESSCDRTERAASGRCSETYAAQGRTTPGRLDRRHVQSASHLAVGDTLKAAAQRQGGALDGDRAVELRPEDLRRSSTQAMTRATIVFAVDASGSMGAMRRVEATTGAVLGLLEDVSQRRDRVGVVAFRGDRAESLLAPTTSVELARIRLRNIATGGATPLAAGILAGLDMLRADAHRHPDAIAWLVVLTDGRGNVGIDDGRGSEDALAAASLAARSGVRLLVLDPTPGGSQAAEELAVAGAGKHVTVVADTADALGATVRAHVDAQG